MAIDTVNKRRGALGISSSLLPLPAGAIGAEERAILLRLYLFTLLSPPPVGPVDWCVSVAALHDWTESAQRLYTWIYSIEVRSCG